MSKPEHMRQVKLVNESDNSTMVSWIDSDAAKIGNYVKLKYENGELSNFMKVVEVYNPQLLSEVVNERSQDYKRTRQASDI